MLMLSALLPTLLLFFKRNAFLQFPTDVTSTFAQSCFWVPIHPVVNILLLKYKGDPPKARNDLVEGGTLVAQASPTR